jgi:hypothetical protein
VRSAIYGVVVAALASACAVQQSPVPIQGSPASIQRLVGTWVGEYQSAASGRSGSITFSLAANADTAFGDVVMLPRGMNTPLLPAQTGLDDSGRQMRSAVLTIRFVTVRDDRVEGTLAPYRDPECGCLLLTRFEGTLTGDRITGTYVSHHVEGGANVKGTWEVSRKRD